jgi:hypothetical protein
LGLKYLTRMKGAFLFNSFTILSPEDTVGVRVTQRVRVRVTVTVTVRIRYCLAVRRAIHSLRYFFPFSEPGLW